MESNIIRLTQNTPFQANLADFSMSINPWWLVGLLLLAAIGGLIYRARYWYKEGKRLVAEPGHVPPKAPFAARIVRMIGMKFLAWRYVGPVREIRPHFANDKRRLIRVINHQTERDVLIVPSKLRLRFARSLMAVSQITGIRIPFAAWQGVIAVHHDANPSASLKAIIKALSGDYDSDGIVFPQGALIRDNKLAREQFFNGSMMIAKKVAEAGKCNCTKCKCAHAKTPDDPKAKCDCTDPKCKQKKVPVCVLPCAIAYDRNPAHATWLQWLLEGIGWKKFRFFYGETMYGAVIAYGEPIPVESLPKDYEGMMDVVYERIKALSDEATASLRRPSDKPVTA